MEAIGKGFGIEKLCSAIFVDFAEHKNKPRGKIWFLLDSML
jgi:hypothetical protein